MLDSPTPVSELPPNEILRTILTTRRVTLADGSTNELDSETSGEECRAMYRFLRQNPADVVIEIGMAYGVSSLAILTALEENNRGRLISIDPYPGCDPIRQSALASIEKSGLSARHTHLHQNSELALPQLVGEGLKVDFIYIDGHHGFDHAFVDLFFADRLVPVGGVIAFDDTQWRSVHRVVKYFATHRHYQELDVGLKKSFASANILNELYKRLQNRFGPSRYFRKLDDWKPPSNFYRGF
ncbi:MAG: class I SAM-dependent methyltransferase [Planctomycetaceae bacterium]|nr:class I SAM-dependent methyltransferase [Planctomycetaceae bacterium]